MKLPLNDHKFVFLLIAVLTAISLEILSLTNIHIPMPYAPYIYGVFILAVGYPVLWNGLRFLIKFDFTSINLLMLIAVIAAFYLGEYTEATVVIVLYILGEKLEDIGIETSMSALDKLAGEAPKSALIKGDGQTTPVEQIPVGTIIQVKPHDRIPLDGIVEQGETSVDESSITGEPLPKEKRIGESVFAGSLNKNGFIEIKTTKTAKDTTFAQIIELTYNAQKNKSQAQKFIQRFARIYTPIVILLAALLFFVPVFILGQDLNHWLNQAITLLVISCPCALVISTPVAIYAAIGNASGKGILIKGSKYLEAMAEVKVIGLDKTRTITYGNPIVSDVIPLSENHREEVLACVAGTEAFSEHPLAHAIVEHSRKEDYELHRIEKFESIVGKGAKANCITCGGADVFVGKWDALELSPAQKELLRKDIERLSSEGKSSVVLRCGQEVKGIIGLEDEIKPDSIQAIEEIKSLSVVPVMLTGDNEKAAEYVASRVGIQSVFSGLLLCCIPNFFSHSSSYTVDNQYDKFQSNTI